MFYDGHPREEPGAVVCRLSPSFTRFGNFQILTAQANHELLRQFMDYTIETDFPHLDPGAEDRYEIWFREICDRTMDMIVHWMRVGFVHGVMNTDNMSVLGLTIDYGPYGWLEDYNPDWTPNTTDLPGRRYSFKNQAQVALWNLGQLANAILPVVGRPEPLQEALDHTHTSYIPKWQSMMAEKLGLKKFEGVNDQAIISSLLTLLTSVETDYTLFFRGLSELNPKQKMERGEIPEFLTPSLYHPDQADHNYGDQLRQWLKIYGRRLEKDNLSPQKRKERMNRVNPKYVLRNYLAQIAIDKAEQGDFSRVQELLDLVRHPYEDQPGKEAFAEKRPEWARHRPGCSMLSCSS
jgi:uncharacterized protein YdiU (UPF0061 family)